MLFGMAIPGYAATQTAEPVAAFWLSGYPDHAQFDAIDGASGTARLNDNGATITVKATGLESGHAYTMWVVYFNDKGECFDGCNGPDLAGNGGVNYGDGKVVGGSGNATFTTRMNPGDGPTQGPPGVVAYEHLDPEYHVVIRSHGPTIAGEVSAQIHSFGGGCSVEVGPAPEQVGAFPVPSAPGECGDVQLYVFSP
jgi:hypothetical protein